ncbi:hypothetical protein GCM10022223_23890 [Kineosporia mesophila]|uniref:Glycosyltransferase RgtA/B/C/D-like domain-containing protein n=1 Tax=Kineosporia mesophila TaxID=566012 RepID=A0ABP6ZFQ1_9ACTN|nr:hypothetical protein [Kineosporia mesophila]MCD5354224.1 hypothetical protein [Kineosporia mesophila]
MAKRTPRVLAAMVLPALVACLLAALRHPRVVYTSDSTAQQSIVRTWLDVGHGVTHLPADTWLFKFPLYLVIEQFDLAPTTKLLIAVLVLTAATFAVLGAGAMLLAPRARWYELAAPLLFLAAMNGGIGSNRNLSNYRNIELGLCFLLLALAARYLDGHGSLRWWVLPITVGLTLFWFDDPYFQVLMAAPLTVLALAWFVLRTRDRRLLVLAGCLLVSFLLLPLLQWGIGVFGLEIDHTQQLSPTLESVSSGLGRFAHDTATQLGVERWRDASALLITADVLTVLVLALLLAGSAIGAVWFWRSRELIPFAVAVNWPLAFLGTLVQEGHPSRYLILAPYGLVVTAVILLPRLRERAPTRVGRPRTLVIVLSCAALVSTAWGATSALEVSRRPSDALVAQSQLMDEVTATGVLKGFAPYWYGNVTSYLTGGRRTVYELECTHGEMKTRSWVSDTARLTRPAQRTFLIWVPGYYEPHGCTEAAWNQVLGEPAQVTTLDDGVQVRVYDYDIGRLWESVPDGLRRS